MKKKRDVKKPLLLIWNKKCFRIMRLTLLFLTLGLAQISASLYSQPTKLNLSMHNAALGEILQAIEKQSEFHFAYSSEFIDMSRKTDADFNDKNIEEVLETIFQGTEIRYSIVDRHIMLYPAEKIQGQSPQQTQKVTGKVTNSSGVLLPGVSAVVKGTTNGAITDANGNYSLSNIPENATLQFSFVGMKTLEVQVEKRTTIDVVMEDDIKGLEEVVVIGYGTVKKQDLTGSVASIRGDVIAKRQTVKVSEALQGALPGVTATRSGSKPGDDATIMIRGVTTIGDSDPLVIIDGISGSLSDINPNDIENISVLKDAASASIYGSKAAAGVILITTKRAKTGQLDLNYNVEYGFDKPTRIPKYVNAAGYMKARNEITWNDNDNTGSEYPVWPQNLIENYSSLHAENPDEYPDTDWLGLLINNYAPRQSHRLSITAGAKNIRTKVSVAYDKTAGLYDGLSYDRITARANNDITINKYLSASIDLNYIRSINMQTVNSGGAYMGGFGTAPYAALWSDGRVAEGQSGYNPYALIKFGGYNNNWTDKGGGKISIDFTPVDGLKISGVFSPNLTNYKSKKFSKAIPYTNWDDPDVIIGYINGAKTTSLTEGRDDGYDITTQLLANYTKTIGEHHINLLAGYENYYSFYESLGASSDDYLLNAYPYLDLANKNFLGVNGNASEYASRSFFSRIMYDYKNKYLLQTNARYDGSSRFDKDYRWGLFPSLSIGWVLSKEPFLENVKKLSFLKVRASWGSLGNERIGTYPYQSTIKFGSSLLYQGNNVISAQNAAITKYAIKDISWETTTSFDIGLDASFFDNKLEVTGDYYKKTTKDMLLALEIPDYMGLDNPDQNTGKMNTNGWEVNLRYNNKLGEINYSISCNISDFKSVMGDLGGTEFIGSQVKFKGSEFNEWYGYKSDGLFQTQEELNNSAVLNSQTKVGDIKYIDISGPNGVPDGKITPEYDRVLLGGSLPRYLYGGNISLNYKNFDFSMVFQGVGKQNSRMVPQMTYNQLNDIPASLIGNYWSRYNSDEKNQKAKYPRISDSAWDNNYGTFSDYWLFNGAYFRLKNITIGYSIHDPLAKKCMLKSARVYASISDMFSIDNYPAGWDPETYQDSYWITSSFIMGVSVNF
jgi:TonB-linked SusC/RagA family outer membrane protein